MRNRCVVATARGGPDVLRVVEESLPPPTPTQVVVKVLATPVCRDDVAVRRGNRPFLARTPFVPGYSIVGEVEALGEEVTRWSVGDRVAALTQFGGWSEHVLLDESLAVAVPPVLGVAEAALLILNYLTAYQVLHRVAGVQARDKVLIVGASGGVGTALLQLGQVAELTMYGTASASKHGVLTEHGATAIDYRTQGFVEVIREVEPAGLDFVLNGMGEECFRPGLAVLRRGGCLVHFGGPQSFARFLKLLGLFLLLNLLPNGKRIKGYGTHRGRMDSFAEDWRKLFALLETGRIRPVIAARLPLLKAAEGSRMLESGELTGSVVLMAPELL